MLSILVIIIKNLSTPWMMMSESLKEEKDIGVLIDKSLKHGKHISRKLTECLVPWKENEFIGNSTLWQVFTNQ